MAYYTIGYPVHLSSQSSLSNLSRIRSYRWIASLMVAMGLILSPACKKMPLGGQVHGFVVAELREGQKNGIGDRVHLPDATVYLKSLPAGAVVSSSKVLTNARGYFIMPRQLIGRYQICYEKDGFVPRCEDTPLSISQQTLVLTHDLILFPAPPGAIVGRALLKDTSICYKETNAFATLVTTMLNLLDGGGNQITGPIRANSYGIFVIPKVPGPGNYQLKGTCALGVGSRSISVAPADLFGATAFNLTLDNRGPVILSMLPVAGGIPVRSANPGDTVQVKVVAEDPDGDTLHYEWATNSSGFTSVDADTVNWTLANVSAANTMFVQVSDGKGGFATRNLTLQAGTGGVLFSGKVVARNTLLPIPGAQVTVGAASTTSNASGAFLLSVPEVPRYVLNVKKPHFALLSRAYYGTATGLLLELDQTQSHIIDSREGGHVIYDGKNVGSGVTLAGHSLVDSKGNPVNAPVTVDVFAYDITRSNPIPGDFSAKDKNGKDARLETYGAIQVEVTDGGGQTLQLASGSTADISISIDPTVQANAPATIPLLSYDEGTGYWKEESTLVRSGNVYAGKTKHLSVFNADTVFNNTACIRLTVADTPPTTSPVNPPRFAPTFPFTLHIDYTDQGGPRHNDFPVTESPNALLRLPPNIDVTLTIVGGAGPGRTFAVKSGDTIPDAISYPPPFDYQDCKGFDPNNPAPGNPVVLAVELPQHEPFLGLPGAGSDAEATAYYKTVGAFDSGGNPTAQRGTFNAWKLTNGLSQDPTTPVAGETAAIYYNNGDLQLGRDMHCKCSTTPCATSSDAACYVTNYGASVFGGPQGQLDVAMAMATNHVGQLASVAMEYRHSDPNPVKFYVYNGAGNLLKSVALDSEGPKFVPFLCLACHGGSYDNTNHDALQANFLPFDVASFLYDPLGVKTLGAQQENFRQLNSLVHGLRANTTDAIGSLVEGWYPCNVNTVNCQATNTGFTPTGWSGNVPLYQTVTRQYCRTCHVAQPGIDWTDLSQWTNISGFVHSYVCNDPRHMPHAEVPYKKFWLSQGPHAPEFMFGPQGLNLGACPP
jgi:hypothetical protein